MKAPRHPATASTPHPQTAAVRAAIGTDPAFGAVTPPVYLSSNYTFEGFGQKRTYDYSRTANPTRDALGAALAELEGGAGAVVTSSGMSAILLVLQLVEPGSVVVAPHDCYGGTWRLLTALARQGRFEVVFTDFNDLTALETELQRGPSQVWIESPSNPLLRITDIRAVAGRARRAGATVIVDNTFLSPALQRPLEFGADLVVHSTTKYLNGHSDVVGGAVIARDATMLEQLSWWGNCLGVTGAPWDSFLTLRGLRTLHARMAAHLTNTAAVVEALVSHPAVKHVYWPGLPGHPGAHIARAQQRGAGAMVSFELAAGPRAVRRFLDGLRYFSLAESLGGVESLIAHPATMTHSAMDPVARSRAGIGDDLLRLSVGIEAAEDLVSDLQHALARAYATPRAVFFGGTAL